MKIDVLTLFPDMVDQVLSQSVVGRGRSAGLFTVKCHQIRDFAQNKHNNVDDTPYGGGNGMVMAAPPIKRCFDAAMAEADEGELRRVIYLSPKGAPLTQKTVERLSGYDRLVLLCGHYEGVDQRVLDAIVDEEVSIGDYVLTGGELPACVLVDAVVRLIPGVLACPECHEEESISSGLLEYPQYTRPAVWEGEAVPEILLSGDHQKIREWRLQKSLELTEQRRPELASAWREAHPPKVKKVKRRRSSEKNEE